MARQSESFRRLSSTQRCRAKRGTWLGCCKRESFSSSRANCTDSLSSKAMDASWPGVEMPRMFMVVGSDYCGKGRIQQRKFAGGVHFHVYKSISWEYRWQTERDVVRSQSRGCRSVSSRFSTQGQRTKDAARMSAAK